ncbi:biopolymer transporter ExbD [Bacteriovoracaceae bacterium]|nr:biopolymer transporter ExbD [Bacteriovoracaceae bacterium]
MRGSRRKRREFLETELTSLIDVVFLLLIFFMATSVFKKDELSLSLTLPAAGKGEAINKQAEFIRLEVTKEKISMNGQEISLEDLKTKITTIKNKKIPIELRIDKVVEYQRVVDILNIFKESGFYNLDLITQKQ